MASLLSDAQLVNWNLRHCCLWLTTYRDLGISPEEASSQLTTWRERPGATRDVLASSLALSKRELCWCLPLTSPKSFVI